MRGAAAKVCRDIYDNRLAASKAAAREGFYGKENDQAMMASGAYACLLAIEALPTLGVPDLAIHMADEWGEEDGDVLWWRFPIVEPPYCGSPLDDDWPGYHTHWSRFEVPEEPSWPK